MPMLKPARVKHYSLAQPNHPDYAQATLSGGAKGTGQLIGRLMYKSSIPEVRQRVVDKLKAKAQEQGYEIVYWPPILRKEAKASVN
jgi:hypothetical protein